VTQDEQRKTTSPGTYTGTKGSKKLPGCLRKNNRRDMRIGEVYVYGVVTIY